MKILKLLRRNMHQPSASIRMIKEKTADENYYLMKIWKKKIISKIQIYVYMRNIKDY